MTQIRRDAAALCENSLARSVNRHYSIRVSFLPLGPTGGLTACTHRPAMGRHAVSLTFRLLVAGLEPAGGC